VDVSSTNATPPYTNWTTAATNIQNAVDAAVAGDEIVVTNGTYATGGRAVDGTMTNRVAVDKLLTLRSVNGPQVTIIRGYQVPGTTNGDGAIRCVYLTNGASLSGFTLTNGATRAVNDYYTFRESSGGGLRCEGTTAVVSNCVVAANSAYGTGGGAYGGTLNNCTLIGNSSLGSGGGAWLSTLNNCALTGNSAASQGGGANGAILNNCTLTGNSAYGGGGAFSSALNNCALTANSASSGGAGAQDGTLNNCTLTGNSAGYYGGGEAFCTMNNCIIYFNSAPQDANYFPDPYYALNYCCTTPLPTNGVGNIFLDPQLANYSHLSAGSPCRGTGSAAYDSGTDIDGEAWLSPPSIGCDEYHAAALTGPLTVAITASYATVTPSFTVQFTALIEGHAAASVWDFGDGATATNQPYTAHAWAAPRDYVVILRAYNESLPGGVSATVTVHVVAQPVHYVAADSGNPVAPYTSWAAAATNIQDAVDAVAVAGALVLVTNGIYATGSRVLDGATNRVVITKPLAVRSVNGPQFTTIDGGQLVGCVSLISSANLSGFTLTRAAAYYGGDYGGGAAYGGTLNNCALTGNLGSGASYSTLNNCALTGNTNRGAYECTLNNCALTSNSGGGAQECTLNNCALTGNYDNGAYYSTLNNCTLTGNWSPYGGIGAYECTLNNSIVYFNGGPLGVNYDSSCTLNYCCTTPQPTNGLGNVSLDPQLASAWRLSSASPCRGAGSAAYASGTDIDGEAWLSPPSIGCDEYHAAALTGPLTVSIAASFTNVTPGFTVQFTGSIEGRAAAGSWDFGDGMTVTNRPYTSHAWAAPGDYAVVLNAHNESQPGGVSATLIVHVVTQPVHYVAARSASPVAPYTNWTTAATNIQDAVDAATVPGALVLVTNGIHATGGGAVGNRVAVDKALTVRSVNGPQFTAIDGGRSVRCAYLTSGASLSGFTLTNGAASSGAGVYCESALAVVSNCVVAGNSAVPYGGGAYGGTLNNCTLSGNLASGYYAIGGGAYAATLNNCTLSGNSASGASGGGASYCTLNNCTLSGNSAYGSPGYPYYEGYGGGAHFCTLNNCALSTNSASIGGGAYNSALNNCTLTGNSGGGANGCTLNDCTLNGNTGGGANGCTLTNCTLTGHADGGANGCTLNNCALTGNTGGGANGCTLTNCTLSGNSAPYDGGGANGSALNNCTLTANSAFGYGGGAYSSRLSNCMLSGNSASQGGGVYYSTLNNCTLTGNTAGAGGGGAAGSTLSNCIVYFNYAVNGSNYDSSCTLNYCCAQPLPKNGAGNISADPQLASLSHLSAGSPCRGAGSAAYASGTDIDGETWLTPPSIGCDEYHAGGVAGPLNVNIIASLTSVLIGYPVQLTASIDGRTTGSLWDFGDGITTTNQPYASHAWTELGDYTVVLRAYNEIWPGGISATVTVHVVTQPVHYVAVGSSSPVAPYTSWATAARNIQDAVDAAIVPGALVLVTNGIYAAGGRAMYGTMTNRVAVYKLLTLRSVNGPQFTMIQGRRDPTNVFGDGAIRCVYLTNGASLDGFTLTNGATRAVYYDYPPYRETSGGGLWCETTNTVVVSNCVVAGNSAYYYSGGAYQGTLINCVLIGNSGNGATFSTLNNCTLTGNTGAGAGSCTVNNCTITNNWGAGSYSSTLNNCALAGNYPGASGSTLNNCTLTGNVGSGASGCALNNCIVYFNGGPLGVNYDSYSTLNYCCTTPQPTNGLGNISLDPQLASAWRLSSGSPCRGAGSAAYARGTDIDGEAWLSPPSIGCDEYHAGALTGPLSEGITASFTNVAVGFTVQLTGSIEGRAAANSWDFGDGVTATNQLYTAHAWAAPGDYAVVLRAYNESQPGGISATVMVHVVSEVHYVAADGGNPVAPYLSWATAATNIQDAVDAATTLPGVLVLVTNGIYSTGGRVAGYGPTNRAAVDKLVALRSVNGPQFTAIDGGRSVRCVYLVGGASLSGFTLTNGAGGYAAGGIFCESALAVVSNCVVAANSGGGVSGGTLNNCALTGNSAPYNGGGAYSSTLNNCTLTDNSASAGGGAFYCTLNNCALSGNSASGQYGGGAYSSTLNNCTLSGNSAWQGGGVYYSTLNNCALTRNSGSGADSCTLNNCALTGNSGGGAKVCTLNNCTVAGNSGGVSNSTLHNCIVYFNSGTNYDSSSTLNYCCATPQPTNGLGNISLDPQLASFSHLSAGSPCRGAGSAAYARGTDIDGEAWLTPPSIGCDEYHADALTGPLSVGIAASFTSVTTGYLLQLTALIDGRAAASTWDFGDGITATNQAYTSHAWTALGDYAVVLRAYNESQSGGISATVTVHVVVQPIHFVAADSSHPVAPFQSWATAATNIQDAVDAALAGSLVLVTNGSYATGGRNGNRVAVDKRLSVRSVNGTGSTTIDGGHSVRCVSLTNGAGLSGFTLTNGYAAYGGGLYCEATYSVVSNCVLAGNSGSDYGGGAYGGTLDNCVLTGNSANYGGGTYYCTLNNCALSGNSSGSYGGGAYYSTLNNCTLSGNSATGTYGSGGGAANCALTNCIVYFNTALQGANYDSFSMLTYCCTTPQPTNGMGNISLDPQLASSSHLSPGSPCRGAGNAAYSSGTDIDGEAWASPPSIGCDEYHAGAVTGLLSVGITPSFTNVAIGFPVEFRAVIEGRPTASVWDFGDGTTVTNQPYTSHGWTGLGDHAVVVWAYNESQPGGISATVTVHVVNVVHYVATTSGNPVAPYTSWATAASNIQDAVDAATVPGALVLVTNGTYATGGRTADGYSTNRVIIHRFLTVRSVNGPQFSAIDGGSSVRCVDLTNGASLSGFTLTNGAAYYSGGGVFCESTNAWISNCVVSGNSATYSGGGVFYGTLNNCTLIGNSASYGGGAYNSTLNNCTLADNSAYSYGGGAYSATLNNCALTGNSASSYGGGAYNSTLNNCAMSGNSASYGGGADYSTLNNCTLTGNSATGTYSSGGGAAGCTLNNCIVYFNTAQQGQNYDSSSTLNYCCTTPQPASGMDNVSLDPELASPSHLSAGSPCRGAGNAAYATGADIDGESWLNPPSIGCDEYHAGAVGGPLTVAISASFTNVALGYEVGLTALIQGRTTDSVWEFGDGFVEINHPFTSRAWATPGDYLVALWSFNESHPGGISATITIHVVNAVHYVAADSGNPVTPYASWATAATNIQNAVDAATVPGALVLVTNGIYASGGRLAVGDSAVNRVALDKPLRLRSVNGPQSTTIDGGHSNRCVYLVSSASLSGFTLTGGAGGGAYGGTINNCVLRGNSGAGAISSTLNNCALSANSGGGVSYSTVNNCTLTGNSGSGAVSSTLNNCIAYFNTGANYDFSSALNYCCATPLPANGFGNISLDPQLASASHLSAGSPCRGAGSAAYVSGADIEGEAWASPPSIGCDEYHAGALTGALSADITASYANVAVGFTVQLTGFIEGRAAASSWDFGDGATATNQPYTAHAWTVPGDYAVVLRAYNESQPGGICATVTVHIVTGLHYVAAGNTNAVAPYTSWTTAAGNIQDAINAIEPGAQVLVTNGAYGPISVPGLLTVRSVNGPQSAIIYGGGRRCAYLASGASLSGFTLTDGYAEQGAGVYCESQTSVVSNCVVSGNFASLDYYSYRGGYYYYADAYGGGAYGGTLNNCTLTGNRIAASYGGYGYGYGQDYVDGYGGGACNCTLNNCTLTGNSVTGYNARGYGYGYSSGSGYGGGAYNCTLNNCTLNENSAIGYNHSYSYYGPCGHGEGGLDPGDIYCYYYYYDIVYAYGGGAYNCILNNSIVSGNWVSGPGYGADYYGGALNYCWTTDPLFVDPYSGNLRLQSNSPCINAGNNAYAPGSTDLDGRPRIVGGTVDIGAYEFQPGLSGAFVGWLRQHGLPTEGSADTADPDGDGMNNWQEWIAGTDPTDAASALRLLTPAFTPPGLLLRWSSDTNHAYLVERTTSLAPPITFGLLRANVPGLSGTTTYIDTTAPSAGAAFYRVGTDSTNGSAPLWLETPLFVPAGLAVTWTSVTNRSYFVERATNLWPQPAFAVVQTNIPGQPGTTTFTDTNVIGSGPWFYRVGVGH